MTLASMLILRNVDPKTFALYNRALAEQGAPTLNRANRRATAKVIAKRDRMRCRAGAGMQLVADEEACPSPTRRH